MEVVNTDSHFIAVIDHLSYLFQRYPTELMLRCLQEAVKQVIATINHLKKLQNQET